MSNETIVAGELAKRDELIDDYCWLMDEKIEWLKKLSEELYPGNWEINMISTKDRLKHYLQQAWRSIKVNKEKKTFEVRPDGLSSLSSVYFELVIKIPEIVVKDKKGNSHKMVDSFIKMPFTFRLSLSGKPTFLRASKTYAEYANSYNFSHANKSQTASWVNLCFGSTVLDENMMHMIHSWNEYLVEMWLIQMNEYFSWESDEGGPYIHIRDVSVKEGINFNAPAFSTDSADIVYKSFITEGQPIIKGKVINGYGLNQFIIHDDLDLWTRISSNAPSHLLFPYDRNRGRTYTTSFDNDSIKRVIKKINAAGNAALVFKKEMIYFRIVEESSPDEKETLKLVHETVKQEVVNKLSKRINKFYNDEFISNNNS